jgi:NTE family protein
MTVGAPALETDADLLAAVAARPTFPPMSIRTLLRRPRLPHPATLLGLGRAWAGAGMRALPMLSLLLPDGRQALAPHVAFFDERLGEEWPDDPLLICAVRRRDCRRAVFGPGGRAATVSQAVTASCAVPGYFSEVVIGGEAYVDGGALSATNADVLRRHDLDLAIVLSPMTGTSGQRSVTEAARRLCRRSLDHEVGVLERVGIPSVVVEPTPEVLQHVPADFMDESALDAVVRESFLATGRQIVDSPVFHQLRERPGVSSVPARGRRAS